MSIQISIFKIITYFFLFVLLFTESFSHTTNLVKPDSLGFISAFEKSIYSKFYNKYKHINNFNIVEDKSSLVIGYNNYQLIFVKNISGQIVRVNRELKIEGLQSLSEEDDYSAIWLGQFLYRLDAGDFAAAYNLVFPEDIKITFLGLSNKADVLTRIMNKYDYLIIPKKIEREILQKKQRIKLLFEDSSVISFSLPKELFIDQEIDLLQEKFYKNLVEALNNRDKVYKIITLMELEWLFPGSELIDKKWLLPFPSKNGLKFPELNFQVKDSIISFLEISLELKDENNISINNEHVISYYRVRELSNADLNFLSNSLKNIYFLLLPKGKFNSLNMNTKGIVKVHSYQMHEISISNNKDWEILKMNLYDEGPLYFFPSQLDETVNKVIINGLLYILKKQPRQYYHFADLTFLYSKTDKNSIGFVMHLYPFAKQ